MDITLPLLRIALQSLLHGLPSLIVAIVALVLLIQRRGPLQAQLGFGLLGALSLLYPAIQGLLAILRIPVTSYSSIYQIVSVLATLAHAGAYVLILLGLLKLLPRARHQ
ncbi:MAG: hypothetical protein IPL39_08055 [Opitutaceae bacterium]|nr:hypothetical protein [Opitutaceae bacterium]